MRKLVDRIVGHGEVPLTPDDVDAVIERILNREDVPGRLLLRVIRALQGRVEDLENALDAVRGTLDRVDPRDEEEN